MAITSHHSENVGRAWTQGLNVDFFQIAFGRIDDSLPIWSDLLVENGVSINGLFTDFGWGPTQSYEAWAFECGLQVQGGGRRVESMIAYEYKLIIDMKYKGLFSR